MKYKLYLEQEYKDFDGNLEPDKEVEADELYGLDYQISVYCRYLYHDRDGWEWMKNSDELILAIDEQGNMKKFGFELDFEPTFYVSERKQDGNA